MPVNVKKNCLPKQVRRGKICIFWTSTALLNTRAMQTKTPSNDERQLKLMMMRKVLMGNLMMRTTSKWSLYRSMSYAICKTKQVFLPAGFYLIVSPL